MYGPHLISLFFFFNDPATTEIYTLPLHDALPILRARDERRDDHRQGDGHDLHRRSAAREGRDRRGGHRRGTGRRRRPQDRKSTRLNSRHPVISYAAFCLKKKKKKINLQTPHVITV